MFLKNTCWIANNGNTLNCCQSHKEKTDLANGAMPACLYVVLAFVASVHKSVLALIM